MNNPGYLTLNLSCPNAAGGKDFFAVPGNLRRLLERLAQLAVPCSVLLKLAPSDDLEELRRIEAEVEPCTWVRGFLFNLPPGKPESLRWISAVGPLDGMPGAVSGVPVGPLIDRCIARLGKGLKQRFDKRFFSGGPTFALAACERMRWIWEQEAPGEPLPGGYQDWGWVDHEFSLRAALDQMQAALLVREAMAL